MEAAAAQAALVGRLLDSACYDHPVRDLRVVETHISHVVLTGEYAYKIKKPLDLGFLDFTTLDARRRFCDEELRLNRRLAADYYLGVVPIAGTPERPQMNGTGPVLEYAVKMRQFPEEALLDRVQARGGLTADHIDAMAAEIARFHGACARADAASPYGTPEQVRQPTAQNFPQMAPLVPEAARARLGDLEGWSERESARLERTFAQRRGNGFVRECHGDLHLGNMFLDGARVRAFDCIEFNPDLRWIDVMSEMAFLVMDLYHRNHPDLARRFVNAYLEITGDYPGVAVLRYYLVYRAMVRAKIAAIRAAQKDAGAEERRVAGEELSSYLELAERFTRPDPPLLMLTYGLSGSGKSALTRGLVERLDALRFRSDVERKRMAGLAATQKSGSGLGDGLYQEDVTRRTYEVLMDHARAVIGGGWSAIVDATFLARWQREMFRTLGRELGVPVRILDIQASEATLRARLLKRAQKRSNASEATVEVLEAQLRSREPLTDDERAQAVVVDGEGAKDAAVIESVVGRLRSA